MASEIGVQTIQHTNGTDAMTIDSSGRVLTPARPALFAQGNSEANVTYANNADVAFATSGINKGEFEQGGMTLVSNTRFTAPVTGLYWHNDTWIGAHWSGTVEWRKSWDCWETQR